MKTDRTQQVLTLNKHAVPLPGPEEGEVVGGQLESLFRKEVVDSAVLGCGDGVLPHQSIDVLIIRRSGNGGDTGAVKGEYFREQLTELVHCPKRQVSTERMADKVHLAGKFRPHYPAAVDQSGILEKRGYRAVLFLRVQAGQPQGKQQVRGRDIGKGFVGTPERSDIFLLLGVVEQGGGKAIVLVGLVVDH